MSLPAGIIKINDTIWELPRSFKAGMRVPVRIIATEKLIREMDSAVFDQAANVACLPGILEYSYCMPDGHSGYGFPIGGVAAMDPETGVISPGGIGFDINCGVRLVMTNLTVDDVSPHIHKLVDSLFYRIPTGVGCSGFVKISQKEFLEVLEQGSKWCLKKGFAWKEDLELTEEGGCFAGAEPGKVSQKAIERGFDQIGTLGSGNHYCEVVVARPENIYDNKLAQFFGFTVPNQIAVLYHCGSRGFGHQVATDYLQMFLNVMSRKYGITVHDRELACAPFRSPEGQDYFAAMKCAVNMAFANRQVILHRIREVFSDFFQKSPEDLGMNMIYDVCHNTAKLETHVIRGKSREVLLHRKGSTRAFGPRMKGIPKAYWEVGQPVLLGGSMETGSYLLVGLSTGEESFFSTAHGSGRTMSRRQAKKMMRGQILQREMEARGIYVHTASWGGLAEEAGAAYKNIDLVAEVTEQAGLSKRVLKLEPIGNIKG